MLFRKPNILAFAYNFHKFQSFEQPEFYHHKLIFHPLVNSGQHSIKNENSLEITNVTNSNKGKCIIFKDINGNEIITYPEYECKPIEPIYVSYWCAIGGLIMDKVYDCTDIDLSCLIEHDRMFISGMHVYYVYEKRKG